VPVLAKLRPRSAYDVCAVLALFVALGGTAYAVNTIGSDDVINDSLLSEDIKNATLKGGDIAPSTISNTRIVDNNLTGADLKDFSLNDEDIGQTTLVHFQGDIGAVPARSCVERPVTGIDARTDHLVLTPDWLTANSQLSYNAFYDSQTGGDGFMVIRVCNPTAGDISDSLTRFNLLVIDAQ
jgi:hypothetical protein